MSGALDISRPCLTRRQLADWSSFSLPASARESMMAGMWLRGTGTGTSARTKAYRVAGLTVERIRTLERHGCFDVPELRWVSRITDFPDQEWQRWSDMFPPYPESDVVSKQSVMETFRKCRVLPVAVFRPRRKRGDTRLYSALDLLTARLAAWWLQAGITMPQVVQLLTGAYPLRLLLSGLRGVEDHVIAVYVADGHVVRAVLLREKDRASYGAKWDALATFHVWYPMKWLARSGFVPKVQEALAAPVSRWNQQLTPAALEMRQRDESRETLTQRTAAEKRREMRM